jgi:hypothetical protein
MAVEGGAAYAAPGRIIKIYFLRKNYHLVYVP